MDEVVSFYRQPSTLTDAYAKTAWPNDISDIIGYARRSGTCDSWHCPVTGVSMSVQYRGVVYKVVARGYAENGSDLQKFRALHGLPN